MTDNKSDGKDGMSAMAYLVDHPPRIRQYRPRRASLWPVIGVHTAESFPDETGPDTGAENVARFIRDRTNYGSYHRLSDSDSRIELIPFDQAAYHIGTHGLNDRTIGISAATQAAKWNQLDDDYVEAMVQNMARDAADAARYVKSQTGGIIPPRRIGLTETLNGQAGFLAHGDADPGRRTDPGASFPWELFLDTYADLMAGEPLEPEDEMQEADFQRINDMIADQLDGRGVGVDVRTDRSEPLITTVQRAILDVKIKNPLTNEPWVIQKAGRSIWHYAYWARIDAGVSRALAEAQAAKGAALSRSEITTVANEAAARIDAEIAVEAPDLPDETDDE